MIKKTIFAAASALCLIGTAEAAVNIAVIAPKSGDYSEVARNLTDGVRAAVSEINARGGLLGQSVNLIEVDDRCDDRFNVSTAQMMAVNSSAEDKVNLVIGPYCSNKFAEVAQIYEDGKILQIVPLPLDGEKMAVTRKGLIKLVGEERGQAAKFFEYYKFNFANQNTALVYDTGLRSAVEIAAAVQQKFADARLSDRLTSYNFANYGKDYAWLAAEILKNNRVVYVLGTSKATAKLTREIGKLRKGAAVFADRYALEENYTDIVGSGQEGLYYLALENLRNNPQFAEILVRMRLKGQEPRGLGVYGYLSVMLWEKLAIQANSLDYDAMAKTAAAAEFALPWGRIRFQNGKPDKSAPYGIYGFQNGEYAQVY